MSPSRVPIQSPYANDGRYHTQDLPSGNQTKGITHAIMAFAKSDLFNSNSTPEYKPFESVKDMRARFEPDTKVMVALGGWGDTEGFGKGAESDESRERYAKNVAAVIEDGGFDGAGMSPVSCPLCVPCVPCAMGYDMMLRKQTSTGNTPAATARTTRTSPTQKKPTKSTNSRNSSRPSARPCPRTSSSPSRHPVSAAI